MFDALLNAIGNALCSTGNQTDEEQPAMGQGSSVQTNDDLVIQLLAARDGYTWQGQIAQELDWSAAKTSRVLSRMEQGDRITRYRVGRKKAVCLPNQAPDSLSADEAGVPTP